MDWFADNPWLAWLGLALILAAIEAATVDFVFLMLAGGAAAGAAASRSGCRSRSRSSSPSSSRGCCCSLVRPIITKQVHGGRGQPRHRRPRPRRPQRPGAPGGHRDRRSRQGGRRDLVRPHRRRADATCQPGQEVRVVSIEGATVIVTGVTAGQKTE